MKERILNHPLIDRSSGCWIYTGYLDPDGYANISVGGKTKRLHRVSYEAFKGPIPDGKMIDHLCRNRACCNPEHAEPVTNTINQRRGDTVSSRNYVKTHCNRGHELAGENLMSYDDGRRGCRTCYQMKSKEWSDTHPDRVREIQRDNYHRNREGILQRRRERRAMGKAN